VPYYILNAALREQGAELLRLGLWGVDAEEPHGDALAAGDLVLVYLGAPDREFIGRAEVASAVHAWTPDEAQVYPGDSPSGVSLALVKQWDPPVPMNVVLSRLDPSAKAKADFDVGVVRITEHEYETVLAVAASNR
jgi:EVE domain